eukprot:TRINITY_DN7904_c0_g1_i1.p2 TRINITY_DN7904_c0_g1~~TRINITY_DN7904_c0_g1_i1.p2  ORF type:complete len:190 (+),score=22.21 TRINITY_DN7904_c0_g1_i1:166-735(+)
MNFTLTKSHGYVIFISSAIGLQCFFTGMFGVGRMRQKHFSKEFMQKNFAEVHKAETGKEILGGGFPDMGHGRYAQALSYKDWFQFNNAQRAHGNFVEQVGIMIPATLTAGLCYPTQAATLGLIYFIGRLAYTIGYQSEGGPKNREFGAFPAGFALMGNSFLAMGTALRIIRQLKQKHCRTDSQSQIQYV